MKKYDNLIVTQVEVFITPYVGKTKAFANVILNNQIKLTGLQVVYDLDEKCVKYPNTGKDDYDVTVVFPITTELRNHIEQSVLKQYMKEVKKLTPKQG
jgi:DNA-binding cell septation regulator SpoVG